MSLTAVIPTYNGLKLLKKHLNDVISCLSSEDEIIIVDDSSSDETVDSLIKAFNLQLAKTKPEITDLPKSYYPHINDLDLSIYFGKYENKIKKIRIVVVVNKENMRFAASANIGVALASNNKVFLINNDVSPSPDAAKVLTDHFEDKRVFAVGCLELEPLDNNARSGKNKIWFEKGLFKHSKSDNLDFGHTAWVSGGSGMFEREKWLEIGGFDRSYYPAYWEDIDLSFRAKKKGWQVLFDPNAIVFHVHESTNSDVFGSERIKKISWKNADTFTWRHSDVFKKIIFLIHKPYWWWKRKNH